MEKIILTDNGKKLLKYLQENDKVFVGKDLIELTNIKGIYPVLNSLIKNLLVEKDEKAVREFVNCKGEKQMKEYETYKLTNAGREFDIE